MNIILLIISVIVIIACFVPLYHGELIFESVAGLLTGCFTLYLSWKEDQYYEWIANRRKRQFFCRIRDDHFDFGKGYFFRHSTLYRTRKLDFSAVQEIRINTAPITALINDNELIFLWDIEQDDILSHPVLSEKAIKKTDNWSLLLDEFLDTEFPRSAKRYNRKKLVEAGISEEEQKAIQKRLKFRFLVRTMVSWEWVYYGHYEVLCELWPLTAKKYWWTMDIALRGNDNPQATHGS